MCARSSRGRISGRESVSRVAVLTLVLGLGWCLVPSAARADPAQAKEHYQRGKSYFQLGDYRHALEEFRAAHVEKADPAFLFNIAECHRRLGEPSAALVFYKKVEALTPPSDRLHLEAEARVAELEAPAAAAAPVTTPPPATHPS